MRRSAGSGRDPSDVVLVIEELYRSLGDPPAFDGYLDPGITAWESDADRMLEGVAELDALRHERRARAVGLPAPTSVVPEDVLAEVWDDTAVARYVLRAAYPDPGADRCYRITDVLRVVDGRWRVVHHHAEALSSLDRKVAPHAGERLSYGGYLRLDELLSCQSPLTDAHDEMLFVVIHQVYELWFLQILHEVVLLQDRLEGGNSAGALHTARRVAKVLKTIVGQLDVLETMTPRQFASFRPELGSASGFQSNQFRELEAVLGRRDFAPSDLDERLLAATGRRTVFDSLLRYLHASGFGVPADVLDRDPRQPWRSRSDVLGVLADVYADESAAAAEVCEALVDIDEGMQEWRYRHVKMVERILGSRVGTGGSSGADYLRATLFRPAFPDLWDVRGIL